MLGSDSGSSDLSEAASLSSDNSSGSDADVPDNEQLSKPRLQQQKHSGSIQPFESSETVDSSDDDNDNDGFASSVHKLTKTAAGTNAPISLSASQPVYSKEVVDRSMMLSPANTKYNPQLAASVSGRGRGRGRGRGLLANRGSRKYDSTETTVIDFDDASTLVENRKAQPSTALSIPRATSSDTVRKKKKETSTESKTKPPKGSGGSSNKQKSSTKKAGNPKSVSKHVYCICREPYDGVEFMIACDRCEEWFHGRCIGMKPQEAKKSRHYYCDTCQRIRSMFGVGTNTDEHAKLPAKPKGQSKKDTTPRPNKNQRPSTEVDEKLPPLKIRAVFHANTSSASGGVTSSPSADSLTMMKTSGIADSYPQSVPKHQAHDPSQEASRRRLKDDQRIFSTQYDTPLTAAQTASVSSSYTVNSSHTSTLDQVSRTVRSASFTMEEEDEDVCPVCDFQCTCNNNSSTSVSKPSLPSTSVQATNDSHSFTAIKVPFRPNPGLQAVPNPSQPASINSGHQPLFPEAEKRPVVPVHVANMVHDDSFHTSLKNPMSTPSGQGASSIARRGGKATAKSPFPVQGIKSKYSYHGHDRKKRNGNTPGHLNYQPEVSYDSDMSGGSQGGDYERIRGEHCARYESDSDDAASDMDDTLSLSSSNSLSDLDETSAQLTTDTTAHSVPGIRPSSNKPWSRSNELVPSTSTIRSSSYPISENRRHKDSPMTSHEPEIALYTPGAANRKLTSKGEPSKVGRVVKPRVMAEVTYITYDPDVAEDVAALNAFETGNEDGDGTVQLVRRPSRDYTEDDIFGDSDLSDELSGELSEIQSEDLDDVSDDSQDFSSIEEDDDDDDNEEDSSPKEFNYSDLEEQDESLLDSDSSINSISTDSSDSSDSATDSGMEVYLQDISEMEDENHGGSDELMDEDELLLLEEQEQLILAKAHGLHDVFSEEDSDPDRNPFESSDDDEDDADADIDEDVDEEEAFDGDDDYYSDDYYDEDDYSDAADDMDEQEIMEQLQCVQSDMQALMMIPPEQQEQLLLLQHYEEAHRQQQQQQQLTQDPMQGVPVDGTSQQMYVAQISQGVDLLADPSFLPTFDLNVPDLDAVSEQLAASLANSLAKSMSASQGLDGSLFSEPAMLGDDTSTLDEAEARFPNNPTNTPFNTSPKAALSASPESAAAVWNAPLSSTHCSLDLGFTSIPPPANISGPLPSSEALDQKPSPVADHLHDPNSPSHASMPSAHNKGQKLKMQASQGKIQSLPNSPLYKPLSSILSVHSGNGYDESLAAQHSFSKANATDSQLSLLNQSRLQSSDPNVFKEAAQKALSGLHGKAVKYSTSEPGLCGAALEDGQVMGDAMDGTCTDMHIAELKRRKDDKVKAKEVLVNGKRRRLSTSSSTGENKPSSASESQVSLGSVTAPNSESESTLPSSSMGSSPASISVASPSKPPSPFDIVASGLEGSSSSFTAVTRGQSDMTLYSFPKAIIPFIDVPSSSMQASSMQQTSSMQTMQKHATANQNTARVRRPSLKGKETKQVDVIPMDDLLDTSALYGQSSRSPSPESSRAGGAGENEGEETEISQAMLKDLNRWERVPIGTFRKSRRPDASSVAIQGALKPGNATMTATLLADHRQQQQQLFQMSHRLHRRAAATTASIRKQRAASVSDILSLPAGRDNGLSNGLRGSRTQQDPLLRSKHRQRSRTSNNTTLMATSVTAGVHATITEQIGLASPTPRDPLRRRRRLGHSVDILRTTAGGPFKASHAGLGLGLGLDGFTDTGLKRSKNDFVARHTERVTGEGHPDLKDLMTDSTQLPSSACPTPLHSPLFGATTTSGRVHHHSSGEPMVADLQGKIGSVLHHDDNANGPRGVHEEDTIVSHLELDIGKEMDGFNERLLEETKD
ncbi:MAG: hypothetical protein J3Q66DRAFT_341104 [Benniella sp.]|nr:MAG: hypothetical protein J3Q66DRAFT_341104 [Benniella sp.]